MRAVPPPTRGILTPKTFPPAEGTYLRHRLVAFVSIGKRGGPGFLRVGVQFAGDVEIVQAPHEAVLRHREPWSGHPSMLFIRTSRERAPAISGSGDTVSGCVRPQETVR
jgi:hypothetical protein